MCQKVYLNLYFGRSEQVEDLLNNDYEDILFTFRNNRLMLFYYSIIFNMTQLRA